MRFLITILLMIISTASCKTSTAGTSLKGLENKPFSAYETVNVEPQFADNEDHFMVYWAIWRTLSPSERQAIGSEPNGAIVSLRDIYWTVNDCTSNNRINMDGEKVWYFDELTFDQDGMIKPIKEAPRADHRYFSMLNLNSQHLRGSGPWEGPKKERGETMEQWDKRRHKAYLEWLHKSWVKGTRGQLYLNAEHRLYRAHQISQEDNWIQPKDYPHLTGEALQLVSKYSPRQWPVYFDERAHKPHSFTEPQTWHGAEEPVSNHRFRMRLDWNWCDLSKPVVAELFVPRGEMPPAGPNRPGRTDAGQSKIKVTEIDWP
jgi:hypothetical protein